MPDLKDKVKELGQAIDAKKADAQTKWGAFDAFRQQIKAGDVDVTDMESDAFKKGEELHKEYSQVADELVTLEDRRKSLLMMTSENGAKDPFAEKREEMKDLGHSVSWADQALASKGYAELKESGALDEGSRISFGTKRLASGTVEEFKALVVEAGGTGAGALFRPDRQGFYPLLERPPLVTDLITIGQTNSNAVEFVKQTGFTNSAAFTAEATATSDASGAKPESGLAFNVVSTTVKVLAHWIPATRMALADAGQLRTIIEEQLRYGLQFVLEAQVANGNGTGQNLTGILNTSGIGSIAKGDASHTTENDADALHRAVTSIRLAFGEPNGVALHPTDWETIRLSKTSGSGDYLYGPPAMAGTQQVWGLPVVAGAVIPQGTGIVADWRQAILWLREGVQVLASDSHSDFFVRNMIAVLAEMRAAFGIVRPDQFTKVTGL
jgi:HK97 family phage major capsid protein